MVEWKENKNFTRSELVIHGITCEEAWVMREVLANSFREEDLHLLCRSKDPY